MASGLADRLSVTGMPADLGAERAILGSCLLDSVIGDVAAVLLPADFHWENHRKIWQATLRLYRRQEPVDYITLANELRKTNDLDCIGGEAYLCSLTDGLPRNTNISHYAKIVREKATRRALLRCGADMYRLSVDGSVSAEQALKEAMDAIAGIVAQNGKIESETLLVEAQDFLAHHGSEEIDWMIHGVIQRGANGIIAADPKSGKSWMAIDMAIAIATGQDWLEMIVPRPSKVALISREDAPGLTRWRINRLLAGRGINREELGRSLWVNTREQSKQFMLDNQVHVGQMVAALRKAAPDLLILDVFNAMHQSEEKDSTQMRALMVSLSNVQAELGCGICIVHHFRKAEMGSVGPLVQRVRGSGSIAGWAEWLMGVSMEDEDSKLRKIEFESKAAEGRKPVYFRIESDDERKTSALVREHGYQPPSQIRRRTAADIAKSASKQPVASSKVSVGSYAKG